MIYLGHICSQNNSRLLGFYFVCILGHIDCTYYTWNVFAYSLLGISDSRTWFLSATVMYFWIQSLCNLPIHLHWGGGVQICNEITCKGFFFNTTYFWWNQVLQEICIILLNSNATSIFFCVTEFFRWVHPQLNVHWNISVSSTAIPCSEILLSFSISVFCLVMLPEMEKKVNLK